VTAAPELATGTGIVLADDSEQATRRGRPVSLYLALGWLVVVILAAALANVLPIQNPAAIHALVSYQAPSAAHWFGTDQLGRDQFARVVYGARISLIVGFSATAIAALAGTALGLVGGYLQGVTDTLVMGLMDVLLAFPGIVVALALTSFLGPSVRNVILAIAVLSLPVFARLTRSVGLSLAQREFVQVARTLGTPAWRIITFELGPNVAGAVLAFVPVMVAVSILIEGTLSFLGIGVPPPTPTWGTMIAQGESVFATSSYMSLLPAAVMFLTILALNTVGRRLSRRSDRGKVF
jgi:peptide/nickel transport system permease protein